MALASPLSLRWILRKDGNCGIAPGTLSGLFSFFFGGGGGGLGDFDPSRSRAQAR